MRERESSSASQSIKTKNAKQGGFVGLELGLGIADSKGFNSETPNDTFFDKKNYPHFPINFQFGYQWYFTQTMGLRLKGYVGYSNYFKEVLREKGYDADIDPDTNLPYGNYDFAYITNIHAIQYGAELAYIWDFLEKGKHTLGLDIAPLGFEGSTYFGKLKAQFSGDSSNGSQTMDLTSYTKGAYTASIGLHYYYNVNHQVFLSYKLRTYSNKAGQKLKTSGAIVSTASNHAILLGYAYKF